MKFIPMTDEQAYETAEELANKVRHDEDGVTIITGDHPTHGHLQIVIPITGKSVAFGTAFKAPVTVLQLPEQAPPETAHNDLAA